MILGFSFNICFFQFQKTRQFGVMLPLYFPGSILQCHFGKKFQQYVPNPKNQRLHDGPGEPSISLSRQFSWRKSPPKVTRCSHQGTSMGRRPSALRLWTSALEAISNLSGGKESTARIEPGKRPKNAGFELDVDFLWPKRENVKIATMIFRGRLFWWFLCWVGLSDLVQMKNYLKDLQWLWWNHTKIEGWIVYNARSVQIRIPMSFGF